VSLNFTDLLNDGLHVQIYDIHSDFTFTGQLQIFSGLSTCLDACYLLENVTILCLSLK